MMSGECCTKKWLLGALVAAVAMGAYDWYVHGTLLKELYDQTKTLWRPASAMKALFPWCFAPTVVLALLFSGAYGCWRKQQEMGAVGSPNCPYKKSVMGFGLWIGLLMGTMMAAGYIYLPIPIKLAEYWFFAGLGKGIVASIALSLVAGHCDSTTTTKKGK